MNHHFIIGMGRSGTNLLLSVLNTSEKNHCLPEVPLLLHFLKEKSEQDIFYKRDIEDLKRLSSFLKYRAIFKTDFERMDKNLVGYKNYLSFVKAGLLSFQYQSKNISTVENIIDKNPIYTFYVDTINQILPKSKFVIMIRDPRGYIASSLEKPDDMKKPHPLEFHAYVWKVYAKRIDLLLKKYPNQCLLVKYEDFVTDSHQQIQKICQHLEISFSTDMEKYFDKSGKENRNIQLTEEKRLYNEKKYGGLRKPIHTGQIDSWKNYLTSDQQQKIRYILEKDAQYFSYDLKSESRNLNFLLNGKRIQYQFLVKAYFIFVVVFYRLPIGLREKIRKLV